MELPVPDRESGDETVKLVAEITAAVNNAPKSAMKLAQQVARKESRRWYLLGVVVTCSLSLILSSMALHLGWQAHANSAAWTVARQRGQDNLHNVQNQINIINATLVKQHKPVVPLPTKPWDASARLALAQLWLQMPKETPAPMGAQGLPGPACPAGTILSPVTFSGGVAGLGCVTQGGR